MISNGLKARESEERLGRSEKLGYGLGDTASNFFFQTFNLYLLYYYTDVFGLSAGVVGTMFLLTRIFDAVTDPLMGIVADRTQTRWGKFRPYLLWVAVPYGVLGYAMFANPELGATGKVVYAYVTYSLMMLAYTAINIPYSALMGVMSPKSAQRTSLSSYRFICAFAGGWAIATFVSPLKNMLGGGNEAVGFQYTMGIFAIMSVLLFWVTFATTRERVLAPVGQRSDLKQDLKELIGNRPWVALFFAAILALTNVAVRNGATVFYFKYYVGDSGERVFWIFDRTALFMSGGTLALILGVACTGFLSKRFGKRPLMIVLTLCNAASMALFFFIPADQFALMMAVNIIGTFLVGPTPALVWAMYADVADYGEWKNGRRSTGLVFSAALFAQKFGIAIGGFLAGWMLDFFGFVSNMVQNQETILGIRLMFCIFPAIFAVLNAVVIWFYPLTDEMVSGIEADLSKRKSVNHK